MTTPPRTCRTCRFYSPDRDMPEGYARDCCQVMLDLEGAEGTNEQLNCVIESILFELAEMGRCPQWRRVGR